MWAISVVLVVSDSLRPYGPQPARLLCPWDSPGKNTGVDYHALLQGIFPTQGYYLSCVGRWVLYHQHQFSNMGIPWQSSGQDSELPLQGAWVLSLIRGTKIFTCLMAWPTKPKKNSKNVHAFKSSTEVLFLGGPPSPAKPSWYLK